MVMKSIIRMPKFGTTIVDGKPEEIKQRLEAKYPRWKGRILVEEYKPRALTDTEQAAHDQNEKPK